MKRRLWSTATTLLKFVLLSLGAATREGVTYRRWHDIQGATMHELYTDPDYQVDNPDYEEVLTDYAETPVNIWCVLPEPTVGLCGAFIAHP